MFNEAASFNSDLSQWNVQTATNFGRMFRKVAGLQFNLSRWNVAKMQDATEMFKMSIFPSKSPRLQQQTRKYSTKVEQDEKLGRGNSCM